MRERKLTSIRAEGHSSIGLSKVTRSMLQELAGDMPVSDYVRVLAERELGVTGGGGSQAALPGQERLVSPNTIAALSSEVRSLSVMVSALLDSVRADGLSIETAFGKSRIGKLLLDLAKDELVKENKPTAGYQEELKLKRA